MGDQGPNRVAPLSTNPLNHWAWGYRWYALKLIDYNSAAGVDDELHGMLNFPQVGTEGGYAMLSERLNKIDDFISAGLLPTDAFNDNSCIAYYLSLIHI